MRRRWLSDAVRRIRRNEAGRHASWVFIRSDGWSGYFATDDPELVADHVLHAASFVAPTLDVGTTFTVSLTGKSGSKRDLDESVWLSLIEQSYFVELTNVLSLPQKSGAVESVYTFRKRQPLRAAM